MNISVAELKNSMSADSLQTSEDSVSISSNEQDESSKIKETEEDTKPKLPFSTYIDKGPKITNRDSGISNALEDELADDIGPLPAKKDASKFEISRIMPRSTKSMKSLDPLNIITEEKYSNIKTNRTYESEKNLTSKMLTTEDSTA